MRGVHVRALRNHQCILGSSPHARGPPTASAVTHTPRGIIPACAGSTGRRWVKPLLSKDHPRMRGVHRDTVVNGLPYLGSSPHARGPPDTLPPSGPIIRIIPACAGSTW